MRNMVLLPAMVVILALTVASAEVDTDTDSSCSDDHKSEKEWSRQSVADFAISSKTRQKLTWTQMAAKLNCSPTWLSSVVLGQSSMDPERAELLGGILKLPCGASLQLSQPPLKAQSDFRTLFQDPLLYRLHEIALVYGTSIKQMIHELFGDGIMSAIDFEVDVQRDGGRVRIVMSGKYLPYRRW